MEKTYNSIEEMLEDQYEKGILIKESDNRFKGKHPDGIEEGYSARGHVFAPPIVGSYCLVGEFHTSMVTEIVEVKEEYIRFKTLNSTYVLKKIKEGGDD